MCFNEANLEHDAFLIVNQIITFIKCMITFRYKNESYLLNKKVLHIDWLIVNYSVIINNAKFICLFKLIKWFIIPCSFVNH